MVHKSIQKQCLATFAACLSMIGWGCNIGWTAISGPQLSLKENNTQMNNNVSLQYTEQTCEYILTFEIKCLNF